MSSCGGVALFGRILDGFARPLDIAPGTLNRVASREGKYHHRNAQDLKSLTHRYSPVINWRLAPRVTG